VKRELTEITPTGLIPLAMGVGLLIIGLKLSYSVYETVILLLLAAGIGTWLVLLLLRSPQWGLVALLVGGLAIPFEIGTGSETGLNPAIMLLPLLMGVWVFDMVALKRRISLPSSRCTLPLITLAVVSLLSFLVGQFVSTPAPFRAQLAGLALFLFSGGAFFLAAIYLRDLEWLKRISWLILAIGACYTGLWLLPIESPVAAYFPPSGATGSLFWTWVMALAAGQVLFNRKLSKGTRIVFGGLIVGILCVGFFPARTWVSGWFPPLVVLVVLVSLRTPRIMLFSSVIGGLTAVIYLPKLIQVLLSWEGYSLITRLEGWEILSEIVKINPILGLGPANYYHFTSFYSIRGWYVPFNSHNNFVDIFAQIGLLGLICFIWFFWEAGRLAWRLKSKVGDGFERGYVYGAFAGLIGTLTAALFGDWVIPFVYNVGLEGFRTSVLGWVCLGGVVAIASWQSRQSLITSH